MPDVYVISGYGSRTGLQVENLSSQLGEFFGVKNGDGVLVRSVEKGSAAEAAGIRAGDVIIRVEGDRITHRSDWNMALRNKSGKVNLGIVREKREQTIALNLPEKKSFMEWPAWSPEYEKAIEQVQEQVKRLDLEKVQRLAAEKAVIAAKVQEKVSKAMEKAQGDMQRNLERSQRQMQRRMEELERHMQEMRDSLREF
jgi:membrane-associated protease RseP (regulator of RpoE activity)